MNSHFAQLGTFKWTEKCLNPNVNIIHRHSSKALKPGCCPASPRGPQPLRFPRSAPVDTWPRVAAPRLRAAPDWATEQLSSSRGVNAARAPARSPDFRRWGFMTPPPLLQPSCLQSGHSHGARAGPGVARLWSSTRLGFSERGPKAGQGPRSSQEGELGSRLRPPPGQDFSQHGVPAGSAPSD